MASVRSRETLRHWLTQLLPQALPPARQSGWQLLQALLWEFTTNLSQLARHLPDRPTAKIARQYLTRWLDHPAWAPEEIYAGLNRSLRRLLPRGRHGGPVLLLVDFTYLQHDYAVLQVSLDWQQRALPLYRAVLPRKQGRQKGGEAALLTAALGWLGEHLPGPRRRYVLVMDRGLPSHRLIRTCQAEGWRFVFRLRREWKLTHAVFTGPLAQAEAEPQWCGSRPRLLRDGLLGRKGKGKETWSVAHVVFFFGAGHQEPWFLATSEGHATRAVACYRRRMHIEAEFRDLKDREGGWGLDELAGWHHVERVARFLAWVAAYEWWLALLWVRHHLEDWRSRFATYGRLSWLTVAQEWLWRQCQALAWPALEGL